MTGQPGSWVSRDGSNNGTTPKAARLALGGLLAKSSTGLNVRKGIMWDGGGAVVSGTAGMAYSVRACVAVVMPSATQGPAMPSNDAALSVSTTAAPGSNSRIDIIWVRQHFVAADGGADTDVISEWGVTQGATAGSPVAPSIPTGAVEIARATVPTGTTATTSLTISQTHPWVVPTGAPIPVRDNTDRATLTAFDGLLVSNLTSDCLERYNGSAWEQITSSDSGWVSVTLRSGYTSPTGVEVRKRGTFCVMRGDVVRTTSFSTSLTACADLAAGYFPSDTHPFAPGVMNVTTPVLTRGEISTAGVISMAMSAASGNSASLSTCWYTD